jgi:hypothetical protein
MKNLGRLIAEAGPGPVYRRLARIIARHFQRLWRLQAMPLGIYAVASMLCASSDAVSAPQTTSLEVSQSACLFHLFSLTHSTEGDIVLLRRVKKPPILTKPLKAGHTLGTHFGTIKHDDILGKSYRDTVSSSKAKYARIHRPTLGEYATLTPRIVTPVGSLLRARTYGCNKTSS